MLYLVRSPRSARSAAVTADAMQGLDASTRRPIRLGDVQQATWGAPVTTKKLQRSLPFSRPAPKIKEARRYARRRDWRAAARRRGSSPSSPAAPCAVSACTRTPCTAPHRPAAPSGRGFLSTRREPGRPRAAGACAAGVTPEAAAAISNSRLQGSTASIRKLGGHAPRAPQGIGQAGTEGSGGDGGEGSRAPDDLGDLLDHVRNEVQLPHLRQAPTPGARSGRLKQELQGGPGGDKKGRRAV